MAMGSAPAQHSVLMACKRWRGVGVRCLRLRIPGPWLAGILILFLGVFAPLQAATVAPEQVVKFKDRSLDTPMHNAPTSPTTTPPPATDLIIWTTPSVDSSGSMPLGNGDIALNAWIEPTGEAVFYVAKSDSVSENGELLKLGRVRVRLSPQPQVMPFRQELRLREGAMVVTMGTGDAVTVIRLWVDAHRPVVRLEIDGSQPMTAQAHVELWRTQPRSLPPAERARMREFGGGPWIPVTDPDTILPPGAGGLRWCHRNARSVYAQMLGAVGAGTLVERHPDPLLHRTFGGLLRGSGFVPQDDRTLAAPPARHHDLALHILTAQVAEAADWAGRLETQAVASDAVPLAQAWAAHVAWWSAFAERSWIHVRDCRDSEVLTRGYTWQRWMMACSGRGALPVKYNGGLFNVDQVLNDRRTGAQVRVDADYRAWGCNYWFQNTRLLYWPLLASGDLDVLDGLFRMYRNALPLVRYRTRLAYGHEGAAFYETQYFWGTASPCDHGWGNPGPDLANAYIRNYWSGNLELVAMMLARYEQRSEEAFLSDLLLPLADAITTFYDQHWSRGSDGRIRLEPSQALETWHVATNPANEIAGLMHVLPRLLNLPADQVGDAPRARWARMLRDLPPLALEQDAAGPRIAPAESYSVRKNIENPELYAVFPFRIYGVGLPDIETGRRTFAARRELWRTCWSQDGIHAAYLGLSDLARSCVIDHLVWANDTAQRFPAFWRQGYDWAPDLDNGGSGSVALQAMLMQVVGDTIYLAPACPAEWSVDFRLHAPGGAVVTARIERGVVSDWDIQPQHLRNRVVIGGR